MKKTLLATAIAGALGMAASGAQAATVYNQDGSKLDLYGNVQMGISSIKGTSDTEDSVHNRSQLFDNGSTLGVKGEHVLDNGLTAYFRAEFEYNADEQKGYYSGLANDNTQSGGLSKGDQAYVGITGNFGDLRVGSWDSIFNDWIQDPMSNDEYFGHTGAADDFAGTEYESDKITYTSPIWSGLQFAVGTQYKGDGDSYAEFDYATTSDAGDFVLDDSDSAALFGGLRYTMGAWTLAAVYDNLKNFQYINGAGDQRDYGDLYGANVGYNIDTLLISFKYSHFDADWNDDADVDRYGVGFRYGYGMGDVYASYQYVDAEAQAVTLVDPRNTSTDPDGETYNEFILGGTYNLSNQMYVWLEGGYYDRTDDVGSGVATGVAYSF